jgi:hypothetical protein
MNWQYKWSVEREEAILPRLPNFMKSKSPPPSSMPDLAVQPRSGLPSFDFLPPTRVVFGVGSLNRLGELTQELGGNRVLVVTDPGLESAGHPQRAVASLSGAGLETFVFDQVEENPTTRHVNLGTAFAQNMTSIF